LKQWLLPACAFVACLFAAAALAQQETRISGVVRDLNTHREISNVNIFVKETQKGTVSDFAGRYELRVGAAGQKTIVVFQHIAYEPREIPLDSVAAMRHVFLQPRVITLRGITVEDENARRLEIAKDLPQTVSLVEAKNFEIRGYVDAGDLLRTDHSVQVEEELSGRKTIAIRGGNADEVVVLYNGVKMNNNFDNVFDLALIDLEDVDRFEVIKGSNTALYGPEAFAGVINIVPKVQHDYNIRFQQRLGTYRSGNWGLHLNPSSLFQRNPRLNASYSFKRGGAKRNFIGVDDPGSGLTNASMHHTANLVYNFPADEEGRPPNTLGAMYINSSLEYDSHRKFEANGRREDEDEGLNNSNQMLSLHYNGNISRLKNLDLAFSLRRLDEEQTLDITSIANIPSASVFGFLHRDIDDRSFHAALEKSVRSDKLDLLFAYQFQRATLDFTDVRRGFDEQARGPESGELERNHHGLVAITKWRTATPSELLQTVDVDFSLRYDMVRDKQDLLLRGASGARSVKDNDWQKAMFKFSMNFAGVRDNLSFNTFLKFGTNTKFPTLFQQISVPDSSAPDRNRPNLAPEGNRSLELGLTLTKEINEHPAIYGWGLAGNFFQNHYDNKFRVFSTFGVPVAFYDNVADARISGFEAKPSLYMYRKKITLEIGLARYFISEKAAFPFKSDFKRTLNLIVDHAGYSFQLHWFTEGEQVGNVRRQGSDLTRITQNDFDTILLPGHTNLDLHLSKTFEIGRLKLFCNASGRNLLNGDDVVLQGLALRDRRYYVTLGAQY
jgi:outer membrane receptor protein involved in Fe transport